MPGAYISYPFCQQKCSFCNFASDVASADIRRQYETTLLEEIRSHAWQWAPQTMYFGGGTPSLMPSRLLIEIMSAIPRQRVTEITIECAPGSISESALDYWSRYGVNRISLGVQSFVAQELRQTGRRDNVAMVESDVQLLRRAGFKNINLDLIAGLPYQTVKSWDESLDWVALLKPAHVSIYVLEVDDESRLGRELLLGGRRYGASDVPDEDLIAELYERAVDRLSAMGFERYEISNFAQPGFQSQHNLKYWRREPYIGFGLDAHSFDGTVRWSNPDVLNAYMSVRHGLDSSAPAIVRVDPAEERFFVGLRLMAGIVPDADDWLRFARPIDKHLGNGLLERAGNRLRLSNRGVLLSNEVFEDFINA